LVIFIGAILVLGTAIRVTAADLDIRIIAFGGKVNIVDDDDNAIKPEKDKIIRVGSTISTGANSWIDLAQGGVSTIRVKARTEKFTIRKSSFEEKKNKSFSLFRLIKGAIYVRVNKANLTEGSKYEIQMPELITGVVGSEGECATNGKADVVHNFEGHWTGKEKALDAGNSMVLSKDGLSIMPTPKDVVAALRETAKTMCNVAGSISTGTLSGGTAAGAQPSGTGVSSACDPSAMIPTASGGSASSSEGSNVARDAAAQTGKDGAKSAAQAAAQAAATGAARDAGRGAGGGGGGCPGGACPPPPPPPPPCR
jgi:hypothetical protein